MKQADDCHRAGQLRTYVEAMREKAEAITSDGKRAAASEWVEWASAFAERLDPLNHEIALPPEIEAKPEALQPFMGGWNAHGPRGWYPRLNRALLGPESQSADPGSGAWLCRHL